MRRKHVRPGLDCVDSTGRRICVITEVHDTYFTCETGHLGHGLDLHIPYDAVDRVEQGQVVLEVSGYELDEQDWYRRPGETPSAGRPPEIDTAFEPDVPVLSATTGNTVDVRFPVEVGATCLGSDGIRIGVVAEVGETTFTCDPDEPTVANLRIPYDSVSRVEGNDVYLDVSADQALRIDWRRAA